jgi:hypothetical protein
MDALNKKERNSAILRFSLWFIICLLLVCIPIIFTTSLKGEQLSQREKENEMLIKEISFEKDYFATQIQKIMDLMKSKQDGNLDPETFNAGLYNIVSNIRTKTDSIPSWRGEMYKNVVTIAEYLIKANKVIDESSSGKARQADKINDVVVAFQNCQDQITDLCSESNKKDFHKGIKKVDIDFKRALKMLENMK